MSKSKTNQSAFPMKRIRLFLGLTAFFLYLGSTGFQYSLDDPIFFLGHKSVQKGLAGTGEIFTHGSLELFDGTKGAQAYRPVCLLAFAVQKQFLGQSPAVSHLINVLLYVVLTVLLFNVLTQLFKEYHAYFAAAVTLLFIVHPLHTEVVASVKSRDELLAGIFCLAAWRYFISYIDGNGKRPLYKAMGFFMLASFTKESSIAFLAVFPLSTILLRRANASKSLLSTLPFVFISLFYLAVRVAVVGTENRYYNLPILTNILNATHGLNETLATKLVILWYHIKLVFVPWPLTWDYSYNQIQIATFADAIPWISLLVFSGLLFAAFYTLKKQPVISFSIFFFLIVSSPTNNFFIKNVTTFAERLLFLPSLGMCIASIWMIGRFTKTTFTLESSAIKGNFNKAVLVLSGTFAVLTLIRTPDWKDNLSLYRSGVEVSPNSSRTQFSLASELVGLAQRTPDPGIQQQLLEEGRERFIKSLEILPENYQAHYNYGVFLSNTGDTIKAMNEFKTVIAQDSGAWEAMTNLAVIYEAKQDLTTAGTYFEMAYSAEPDEQITSSNLTRNYVLRGQRYAAIGNTDSALTCFKNGLKINPEQISSLTSIAELYAGVNMLDSALVYLKKAGQLDESNVNILERLAELSCQNRNYEQGLAYAGKALSMNSTLPKSLETMARCYEGVGNKDKAAEFRNKLNGTGSGF